MVDLKGRSKIIIGPPPDKIIALSHPHPTPSDPWKHFWYQACIQTSQIFLHIALTNDSGVILSGRRVHASMVKRDKVVKWQASFSE